MAEIPIPKPVEPKRPQPKYENINYLHVKNFEKKPRTQINYAGEQSAIRRLEPHDKVELKRFKRIQDFIPENIADSDSTDHDLIEEAVDNRPGLDRKNGAIYTFGVSGSHNAPEAEKGELQGWINFYRDEYVGPLQDRANSPRICMENSS
jgi:hypothetical protein